MSRSLTVREELWRKRRPRIRWTSLCDVLSSQRIQGCLIPNTQIPSYCYVIHQADYSNIQPPVANEMGVAGTLPSISAPRLRCHLYTCMIRTVHGSVQVHHEKLWATSELVLGDGLPEPDTLYLGDLELERARLATPVRSRERTRPPR